MTVVNPKSISGITSITTPSGSDDLLTIHTNNGTERLRVDSTGATKIVTGIVTTLTATTGIVTTLTANTTTHLSDVTFTGSSANIIFDQSDDALEFNDDAKATFGTGADTTFTHSGADFAITNTTGNLNILNNSADAVQIRHGNETMIKAISDGAVELYHDGSKKFETNSTGTTLFCTGNGNNEGPKIEASSSMPAILNFQADAGAANNDKSRFYGHQGGGQLLLQDFSQGSFQNMANFKYNGAVELYHAGTKQCETSADGLAFPSGKGISFAATADSGGTMANELLDDYEEGTWIPKLAPSSSYASIHENGVGRYTKIGNKVHCTMHWIDKDGTAFPTNEQIMIYNFPFTIVHVGNNSDAHYLAPFMMAYNVEFGGSSKQYFYSQNNQTTARGLVTRDGTSWTNWNCSDWNQDGIYFDTHITYMTTT